MRIYILKASDAHLPMAWMIEGGTPFSARDVAPPALSDCPAVSELKKCLKHLIKNDRVGMTPVLVSQRGRECHRFTNLCGLVLRVTAGAGTGCKFVTLTQPIPATWV